MFQRNLSSHKEDFYCLNCINLYTSKNKLKDHEEIRNNHDSYRIEMSMQVEKILKYNRGEKSLKATFRVYLDLSLLIGQCLQDVDLIKKKNKLNYYGGKDCIEKVYKKLRECPMKIIEKLMIEKRISSGIFQATHMYAKGNNKFMKITIKALTRYI